MKRFIQYYDENGNELIGSDGVWVFDQRWSNDTVTFKAKEQAAKQAEAYRQGKTDCPWRAASMTIMMGELLGEAYPIRGYVRRTLDFNMKWGTRPGVSYFARIGAQITIDYLKRKTVLYVKSWQQNGYYPISKYEYSGNVWIRTEGGGPMTYSTENFLFMLKNNQCLIAEWKMIDTENFNSL